MTTDLKAFATQLMNHPDDLCPQIDQMSEQEQEVADFYNEAPADELPDPTMTKRDYEDHANALEDLSTALDNCDLEATESILARLTPSAISYLETLLEED